MPLTLDQDVLKQWIGRKQQQSDVFSARQARLMETTLDRPASYQLGDPLPPLWHWLYFANESSMSELGRDGHPALGGFLPPVNLPRRMWAGGRLSFHRPLNLGAEVTKTSEILSVDMKHGKSGQLCFVTVRHTLSSDDEICVTEEHDIVYRGVVEPGKTTQPRQASNDADWNEQIETDPVLLFRYSALTFNGHRIHYDADFCRDIEGYPGLIVHGPLIATLLADLALRKSQKRISKFSFRATSPLFCPGSFWGHGKPNTNGAALWARSNEGALAMKAEVEWEI